MKAKRQLKKFSRWLHEELARTRNLLGGEEIGTSRWHHYAGLENEVLRIQDALAEAQEVR